MSSVVQNILDNTIGDGARSTKFDCIINFAMTGLFGSGADVHALVKTSQFPGKSHEVIELPFKGRTIPIKGQTKYDNTWTCTFYMTEDHRLKTAFENWIESIDQQHNIKSVSAEVQSAQKQNSVHGYTTNMNIAQTDFHGQDQMVVYELFNVFPKSVAGVDVNYSAVGEILEFTVEFSYSYYNVIDQNVDSQNLVDGLVSDANSAINSAIGNAKSGLAALVSGSSNKALDLLRGKGSDKGNSTFAVGPESMGSQLK